MPDANPNPITTRTSGPQAPLPWWGNIATLWLLAAPLVVLAYCLLQPIAPNDFWYHLRAGWWISSHGALPQANTFSHGVPADTPYLYQSWLAEWLLYRTAETGLANIVLLRAFCLTLAVALLVHAGLTRARQLGIGHGIGARCAAAGALVGFLMFSNNVDIRPQTFSVPLFALWIWLLVQWTRGGRRRKLGVAAALVITSALWSNTHGAFPAGLLALCCCAVGELVWRRSWHLGAVALLCCAAVTLNPAGPGIYRYLYLLGSLPIGRQYIAEWLRPEWNEWHGALFLISPLFWLGGWFLSARGKQAISPTAPGKARAQFWLGLTPGEWLSGVALFAMGMGAVRAVIWYALWAAVALACVCASVQGARQKCGVAASAGPAPAQHEAASPPALILRFNAILLVLLCLAPLALLPGAKPDIEWPGEFRRRFAPTPTQGINAFPGAPPLLLDASTPVEAVELLKKSPPRGKLFNEMVYGSYVMWALHPDTPPYCDPRIELYPAEFWHHYLKISEGGPQAVEWLLSQGFSDLLLDNTTQSGLVAAVKSDRRWRPLYSKGDVRLFRRRTEITEKSSD